MSIRVTEKSIVGLAMVPLQRFKALSVVLASPERNCPSFMKLFAGLDSKHMRAIHRSPAELALIPLQWFRMLSVALKSPEEASTLFIKQLIPSNRNYTSLE